MILFDTLMFDSRIFFILPRNEKQTELFLFRSKRRILRISRSSYLAESSARILHCKGIAQKRQVNNATR